MTAHDLSAPESIALTRAGAAALLEGTTPGEWNYQHGWGIQVWTDKGVGLLIWAEQGTLASPKDQELMARAPALARQLADALGEVERLRYYLERTRTGMIQGVLLEQDPVRVSIYKWYSREITDVLKPQKVPDGH